MADARGVKVNGRAYCGRPCTFTIIVSATDIIFVARYRFKGIKYDIVMYTKNAAQCTIHRQTRIFRPGSKHAGGGPGYWQVSLVSIHSSDDGDYARLCCGALWHSDRPI